MFDYNTLATLLRSQGYKMIRTLADGSQEWRKGEATKVVAFDRSGMVYYS